MQSDPQTIDTSSNYSALSASDIIEGETPDIQTIIRHIRERGFVVLRGVLPMESVDAVIARADELLKQPSVAGVWGYFRADH